MTNQNKTTVPENAAATNKFIIPPRGQRFKDAQIFTERFVIMRGDDYYMRLFSDGSSEFVRFDARAKRWVFLCFPAA